jgi:hypothetical protein
MSKITKKDIQILKDSIRYESETGIFYRKTGKLGVVKLDCKNKHGVIVVNYQLKKKHFMAWRCAVLFVYGYYPAIPDSPFFKDGDNLNLKIDNILVIRHSENEQTIMDFSTEHNLSPSTVSKRMATMPRVSRRIFNTYVYFYEKSDFMAQCGDMIGAKKNVDYDDGVIIKKQVNIDNLPRKNKTAREFLKTWIGDMPTKWEMTLCR